MYIKENRIIVEQVARALSVLPNIRGVIFDDSCGLLLLFIPNQNAVEILSALRKSMVNNDISASIEAKPTWQSYSGFESPVNSKNYDIKKREWKWERTTLPTISSQ
jgi:hypothetical protein